MVVEGTDDKARKLKSSTRSRRGTAMEIEDDEDGSTLFVEPDTPKPQITKESTVHV